MIRLGSLAGYAFEGPRLLAGWKPPSRPGVFAVLYKPEPEAGSERYGVIYVGHSEDLSQEGFPFRHPRSKCWLDRVAGDRFKLHICILEAPGALPRHREQITQELLAVYKPGCNPEKFDRSWREQWIGDYTAPTTGPLTTKRDLSED